MPNGFYPLGVVAFQIPNNHSRDCPYISACNKDHVSFFPRLATSLLCPDARHPLTLSPSRLASFQHNNHTVRPPAHTTGPCPFRDLIEKSSPSLPSFVTLYSNHHLCSLPSIPRGIAWNFSPKIKNLIWESTWT